MDLNSKIKAVKPSATLAVTARANELKAQGVKVIPLAAGEPDFDTPAHIKQAAIKALEAGQTKYTPSSGILPLREAVSEKFARDNGLKYSPKQIVVNSGAKHSLYSIFQIILEPGDEVIVPSPYWVSYPEFNTLAGGTTVFIPTTPATSFRITPQQLEKAITPKTRAFVLNSPSNPTGMGYDKAALEGLAAVLRKHPRVAIVADEIYEALTYGGFKHHSIAALAPDLYDRTFTVNGFSKTYSMTGWRLGYVACPDEGSAKAMGSLQDQSTSGTTTFAQFGAIAALKESQDCIATMRKAFDERRAFMVDALNKIPGVKCLDPQGAFYVFPDVSAWKIPSLELSLRLLDEVHVALVPGSAFGAEGFVRMSFATSLDNLREAIKRLTEWHTKNVKG